MNVWYETAATGTGLFAISILFHMVYKLSILHWTKMVKSMACWFDLVHYSMQWKPVESKWQLTTLSHCGLHDLILHDLNKACFKYIFLYSILLDHYLPHLLENSEKFNVYTYHTMFQWAVQSTEYSDLYVCCTVHCDIIMQHEPMKCTLFKLILWFNFLRLPRFEPSWEWTHEVWNTHKMSKIEKSN
jgi:hypothetical protein